MAKPIDSWEIIAKASELPSRSVKHIEVKGKEIALFNLGKEERIKVQRWSKNELHFSL